MGIFGPTPPKLDDATRARVAKLVGMLTSANDGEVLNAARLINSTLKTAGADINDLAAIIKGADGRASTPAGVRPTPGIRPETVFKTMAEACLRRRLYDAKTKLFLDHMVILTSNGRCPSDTQADWLMKMYAELF
jgi:hypothetical protein